MRKLRSCSHVLLCKGVEWWFSTDVPWHTFVLGDSLVFPFTPKVYGELLQVTCGISGLEKTFTNFRVACQRSQPSDRKLKRVTYPPRLAQQQRPVSGFQCLPGACQGKLKFGQRHVRTPVAICPTDLDHQPLTGPTRRSGNTSCSVNEKLVVVLTRCIPHPMYLPCYLH